ncbi:hypothetical protein [Paraburkholderia sp. J63]|uniref:hypothetical protein n=1 Tax=Paraburkholderia sp. J63 TaxID=2805434 RepID=UPI002ABDC586|nr:hypothetical protein [Paraburkholderia sp. J63]
MMEPLWEWRWAYWDEARGCFAEAPVWMTDEEARSDWWAWDDRRSHRLDYTKRDRHRSDSCSVDPPARDVDWTRERRQREERSRYSLPPFVTPLYAELRWVWRAHPLPEVRCLALEVQCGRLAFAKLDALTAEIYWHMDKPSATIGEARRELRRIRRRLKQEMLRIGPVRGDDASR